jgi:chromosome segregation ATPase
MRLDEAKNYTSGGALVKALQAESRERALGWLTDAATLLAAQTLLAELQAAIPTATARLTALEEDQARAAAALSDAEGRYAEALAARILAGQAGSQTYSDALQDLQHADRARIELAGALRAAEGRVSEAQRDLQRLQDHEAALQAVTYTGPRAIEILLRGETC